MFGRRRLAKAIPLTGELLSLEGLEDKWSVRWEAEVTYRFDGTRPRDEVFSIDTPPPTVSGSLPVFLEESRKAE